MSIVPETSQLLQYTTPELIISPVRFHRQPGRSYLTRPPPPHSPSPSPNRPRQHPPSSCPSAVSPSSPAAIARPEPFQDSQRIFIFPSAPPQKGADFFWGTEEVMIIIYWITEAGDLSHFVDVVKRAQMKMELSQCAVPGLGVGRCA